MEKGGSYPYSQEAITCPLPQPDQAGLRSNPLLEEPFNVSSHLRLYLSSGLFPSGFATKVLYATLFSSIRATYAAHFILLDLITRIIFGDEYRS
jgi:hypothetical protein